MKFYAISVLACAAALPGLAQPPRTAYPCEASPAVRQALANTPNVADFGIPLEDRMKPLRALLEKYPQDIFVQRYYQDRFRQQTHLYREFDRALAMYRAKPGDPVFGYLEARLTGSFDAVKAGAMLADLIAREPAFPWPHLGIAELTDRMGSRDAKKAEPHLRAFLAACPASIEGYTLLRTAEDPEMIRDGAAKLRPLLEARVDSVSLPYWRYLWDLEFRAAPKGGEEAVRRRVLNDTAALKQLPPVLSSEWYRTFRYAADLTKDPGLSAWLEDAVLKHFPGSMFAVDIERSRWSREHPRPGRGATQEEIEAYRTLEKGWQADLAKRFPRDNDVVFDRWQTVQPGSTARPLEERLAIADAFAALMRRSPDAGSSAPPLPVSLAGLYTQWRVRLDRVPALIQEGLKEAELESKYRPDPGMFPEDLRKRLTDPVALTHWRAFLVLADLYLYQRKPDQAREVIQVGLSNVERRPVLSPNTDQGRRDAEFRRQGWLVRQARLAELEGEAPLALSLYRQYTQSVGRQGLINARNSLQDLQDSITDAKRAYLASGGKEESWLDWAASPPAPAPPAARSAGLDYSATLPNFQAKDLDGTTWSLADFKGKATFIDVWATWCGACRAEHPMLQELYDRIKGRNDIRILTFSMDDTSYLPAAYMKEQRYTFPVIASKDLGEKLLPMLGFPQHWIVDAQGRRSSPYLWPLSDFERAIAELERAAGAK